MTLIIEQYLFVFLPIFTWSFLFIFIFTSQKNPPWWKLKLPLEKTWELFDQIVNIINNQILSLHSILILQNASNGNRIQVFFIFFFYFYVNFCEYYNNVIIRIPHIHQFRHKNVYVGVPPPIDIEFSVLFLNPNLSHPFQQLEI